MLGYFYEEWILWKHENYVADDGIDFENKFFLFPRAMLSKRPPKVYPKIIWLYAKLVLLLFDPWYQH